LFLHGGLRTDRGGTSTEGHCVTSSPRIRNGHGGSASRGTSGGARRLEAEDARASSERWRGGGFRESTQPGHEFGRSRDRSGGSERDVRAPEFPGGDGSPGQKRVPAAAVTISRGHRRRGVGGLFPGVSRAMADLNWLRLRNGAYRRAPKLAGGDEPRQRHQERRQQQDERDFHRDSAFFSLTNRSTTPLKSSAPAKFRQTLAGTFNRDGVPSRARACGAA
jgi:hypothetical protein